MKEEVRRGDKGTTTTQKAEGRSKKDEGPPLQKLIESYLEGQTFSERTRHGYRARLRLLAGFLEPSGLQPREITKAHLSQYAATLDGLSPATRTGYLQTIKSFFAWLCEKEILIGNPASHLCRPRASPPETLPLTEAEAVRLLNAPDTDTILGLRNRALLEVLYATGMRVDELLHLQLQDLDLSRRLCFIRKGKGGKGRWVPLTEEACRFTAAYLEASRPRLIKNRFSLYLFLCRTAPRLGIQCVQAVCKKAARRAGITRRVYPHLLRHTAACHLLENGASLFHVQLLLGHALATTTQRYTHVSLGHLKEAFRCHPHA